MKLKFNNPTVDSGGQDFTHVLTCRNECDGVLVYTIALTSVVAVSPEPVTVKFVFEKDDIYSVFYPNAWHVCTLSSDWAPLRNRSRSASGAPVLSLIGQCDNNRLTASLSDCENPVCLSVGLREEECTVVFKAEFFTEKVSPLKEYRAELRLDFRDIAVTRALKDVRAWWTGLGYMSAYVPRTATFPMYSTWYSMHQNVSSKAVLEQCRIAKTLGMDTVIIDDGWQTGDNNRGYAYCGDWNVCVEKIPDMRALVDELHGIGMKVMLWFSVPFMGKYARAYERFADKFLYSDDAMGAGVLDPRYSEVREYLCGIYARYAEHCGIDGFKLDFIDNCRLTDVTPDITGGDCISLEDGIGKLLNDIKRTLKVVNPNIMIEFRQTYMGAVMQRYGNMFRVGDCPSNAPANKYGIVELRLLSNGVAVHADPIVWNESETVENAAMQLNHALFAVPQISVDLTRISAEHKKMLAYYMTYQRANRDTLLFGDLDAAGFVYNYTSVTATGRDKTISAVFDGTVAAKSGNFDVINATGRDAVVLSADKPLVGELTVVDCVGETVRKERVRLAAGLNEVRVPVSGFAFFKDISEKQEM